MKQSLQDEFELAAFMALLKREGVRSYLEIGSNAGGTLRWIATALDRPSKLLSVDAGGDVAALSRLVSSIKYLNSMGHHAQFVCGDSTDTAVVSAVNKCAPFDCVFIDANHTLPFVTKDWVNYGSMARVVAFHDIAWRRAPEWKEGRRIDVPQFWNSIKGDYRHEEIRLCPTGKNNGIGVLWRC